MANPSLEQNDKQQAARIINIWLDRSGVLQHALAGHLGVDPDTFWRWYKDSKRPINSDPQPATAIVEFFAGQPRGRATAAEALQFFMRTHIPLNDFAHLFPLFPEAEWQQAIQDVFPDKEALRRLTWSGLRQESDQLSDGEVLSADHPYLLVSLSTDPDNTWAPIYLTEERSHLGRLLAHEVGPGYINLNRPHVSYEHALIIHEGTTYHLQNWHAKYGVGLYEKSLGPGQAHTLRHGDVFRIPDHEEHYRVMFLLNDTYTLVLPFHMEHSSRSVRIFEHTLALSPLEYDALAYLHHHRDRVCSYEELIAHLWSKEARSGVDKKDALETLLINMHRHIADASGGFTFMQTIGKLGIRLVI